MDGAREPNTMKLVKLCPGSFLLQIPTRGIFWLFNAWPDSAKFIVQHGLELNGVVYPDLRLQGSEGVSGNLVEFPLLHALFNQGMLARGEKPCLVGTARQLQLAWEGFKRGLLGFYSVEEMEDCDLSLAERQGFMREIEALSLNGVQGVDELLEQVLLAPLEELPTLQSATQYRGVRFWKEAINVFGVECDGERLLIDCNLRPGESYVPPLQLDIKPISYRLFQIIDTGEEDGFSPRSCMHTVIQWRDKIICIDLPMNVSYLLDKVSISRPEIDAVIFTHNHDDHIGELSMLLQMDKKVTVICPRIVWKSILLKASAMFAMEVAELAEYFDYAPLRFGEEYDYAGLRILAHPSIHSVPCAVYRIRGFAGQGWKSYSHLSDILNFARCRQLIEQGTITEERFARYRDFLLAPATVKKIDVGARKGTELFSVHGFWKDFQTDASEHIILGHTRKCLLDEQATVAVGQMAVAGSARDMSGLADRSFLDKYRECAIHYLSDYFFTLLEDRLARGLVRPSTVLSYVRILADCDIRLIQPHTPFLKMGGDATFVDLVISGKGSVWVPCGEEWNRVARINAGDLIGDMGVLLQIPRTAVIRSDTYVNVLRIPGFLFREIAIWLGIFSENPQQESVLEKIWRCREVVQGSQLFGAEVPLYLQNKIAQRALEFQVEAGEVLYPRKIDDLAMVLSADPGILELDYQKRKLPLEASNPPVFGETCFVHRRPEAYRVIARRSTAALCLEPAEFGWIGAVPIFKLRLKQLEEKRSILIGRAARQM